MNFGEMVLVVVLFVCIVDGDDGVMKGVCFIVVSGGGEVKGLALVLSQGGGHDDGTLLRRNFGLVLDWQKL